MSPREELVGVLAHNLAVGYRRIVRDGRMAAPITEESARDVLCANVYPRLEGAYLVHVQVRSFEELSRRQFHGLARDIIARVRRIYPDVEVR